MSILRLAFTLYRPLGAIMTFLASTGILFLVYKTWDQFQNVAGLYQVAAVVILALVVVTFISQILVIVGFLWRLNKRYVEFYGDRRTLNVVRGGLDAEIEGAEEVWVAWATGAIAAVGNALTCGKITRLVLLSPKHPHIAEYGRVLKFSLDKQRQDVETSTKIFPDAVRKGHQGEVKWTRNPIAFMVIADPSKDWAWARVEGYFSRDGRPSYIVYKRDWPELFQEILAFYNTLFSDADPPELQKDRVHAT